MKRKLYGHFQWIEFNCLNPAESFQGDSLLLTTKSPGFPGTHLIDLAMKPLRDFKPGTPGFEIDKHY